MRKNYSISLFILIIIKGCDGDIRQIIKHQDEIISLSQKKEIIIDNDRDFYMLITYTFDNKMQNEYNFKKKEETKELFYDLMWDSIQFTPDTVININKEHDKYREEICNYYLKTSQILESYRMKSLSGEIYKNSPKLTIYLEKGGILIYQPNVDISKNKDFENFKEIRDGWYLLKQ